MDKMKNFCIVITFGEDGMSLMNLNALQNASVLTSDKKNMDFFLKNLVICEDLKVKTIKSVEIKKRYAKNLLEKIDIFFHGDNRIQLIYEKEEKSISIEDLKLLVIKGLNDNLIYHIKTSLMGNFLIKRKVKRTIIKIKSTETYKEIIDILKK